ncbi:MULTISPECIES: GNAT family N-acetyltransferase [unclassified Acinetobacter]|uniref:GNAT family N-acetyltransferase n=1 Tax=unclassified Acinetobacter TaxID=196816 RepID=UPI00190CA677|nr:MULTISPECIES: N-acetyltransferase [unclassified Acinetobacter]MBK0063597.1 N-acetyltransferase [Acinetobacter sp. S55]MBK0067475.1 N-acetyltransferase [Acinetobacter sp. S54]
MNKIIIRSEQAKDIAEISEVIRLAFLNSEYSSHTEQFIVNSLRQNDVLTLSLVAEIDHILVGHIAISPVQLSTHELGWYGFGPVSILPKMQKQGIGSQLILSALEMLKDLKAKGCVLLGDPNYYHRFGFKSYAELILKDVPAQYFQAISFNKNIPQAIVTYHSAFNATE